MEKTIKRIKKIQKQLDTIVSNDTDIDGYSGLPLVMNGMLNALKGELRHLEVMINRIETEVSLAEEPVDLVAAYTELYALNTKGV